MAGEPKPRDIIAPSGWPAVVEQNDGHTLITRSMTINEARMAGVERLAGLELSDNARRILARQAGFLELLNSAA